MKISKKSYFKIESAFIQFSEFASQKQTFCKQMHHELFEKHIFCRYFISVSSRKICISNMISDVIIISFQFFSELFFYYSLFITLLRMRYVKIVYFINSLWWIKNVIMALKINSIHFEENSRWKETCKSIWTICSTTLSQARDSSKRYC